VWEMDGSSGQKEITVCDPDLNFPNGANIGEVSNALSKPTVVTLEIPGRWRLVGGLSSVVVSVLGTTTYAAVTCSAGMPVTFLLENE
jgi:hypothetical protein